MARRKLTSPLALAVLATLLDRPMHPYEIARVLKHRGKDESIKIRYGSLYTVVQNLEAQGFVAEERTARAGRRPERTVYRITDDGREELKDRLRDLLSKPVKEYPQFEAALSLLGALSPGEIADLLAERLRLLKLDMAATRAILEELIVGQRLPRIFLLETEYALAMKKAEADWVRGLIKELSEGTLDGVEFWRSWHENGKSPEEWQDREWFRAEQALLGESEVDEPG